MNVSEVENVKEGIKRTSKLVTVFLFACSVYVTASLMTDSRNDFRTPRVSS